MNDRNRAQALTRTPADTGLLTELSAMLREMSESELERFYRGTFTTLTVAHAIFEQRFPAAFARVDREIVAGQDPMKL